MDPQSSKKPEFIIIEDTRAYLEGGRKEESFEEFLEEQPKAPEKPVSHTFFLRLISFISANICFWLAFLQLIMAAVMLVIAGVLLFQVDSMNQSFLGFWKMFKTFFVCLIGFLIGMFNPALGLGMIMLYFSLKTDSLSPLMSTLLKSMTERL